MDTYDELIADGWEHLVNAGNQQAAETTIVALRMVSDSNEYLVGGPKETDILTSTELSKRGIVGIYRRSGKASATHAYPVIFPDGWVEPTLPWTNPKKKQWVQTKPLDVTPTLGCAG